MKIVYVVETYTDGLGYIDNILPREIVKLGYEVDVLTCGLPPYYMTKSAYFGELNVARQREGLVHVVDGVNIHWMPYNNIGKRVIMRHLHRKLLELSPDIVIVRGISSLVLGQVIVLKMFCNFKVFTSTGKTYLSIPEKLREGKKFSKARVFNFFSRFVPGRILGLFVTKCIGSTDDCIDCAVEFYGVPRNKTEVISLGVDTDLFFPVIDEKTLFEREETRAALGILKNEVVCLWSGRMTPNKGVQLLAKAIEELNQLGYSYRALFIGAGPEAENLTRFSSSIIVPFMPWGGLPPFYRAADLAVWPRSMTTSTLDASACGLPVILSDKEKAIERWVGIGTVYEEGSIESLKEKLLEFYDDKFRLSVGRKSSVKIKENYSWNSIAKQFCALFLEKQGINS